MEFPPQDEAHDSTRVPGCVVTPAMIEAGALEVARYDPEFETAEDAALRIFQAMVDLWEVNLDRIRIQIDARKP